MSLINAVDESRKLLPGPGTRDTLSPGSLVCVGQIQVKKTINLTKVLQSLNSEMPVLEKGEERRR